MAHAKEDPAGQDAFILNLNEHWFTLRRFGKSRKRWYNLNSMKAHPTYVTETYLSVLLAQMESDGYSIFAVIGDLPDCEAELYAMTTPEPTPEQIRADMEALRAAENASKKPTSSTQAPSATQPKEDPSLVPFSGKGYSLSQPTDELMEVVGNGLGYSDIDDFGHDEDPELAHALAMSLQESLASGVEKISNAVVAVGDTVTDNDSDLEAAILMSLEGSSTSTKRKMESSDSENSPKKPGLPPTPVLSATASTNVSIDSKEPLKEETEMERMRRLRLERFGQKPALNSDQPAQ
jgi:ataxin-3